jgi:hypothetical protein
MIVTIPVGRMARWASDMKHGYSPIPEGETHAFLNHAGLTKAEVKRAGGSNGDPWCTHCGRAARKHPDIDYPVFVPPPEWERWAEADIPLEATRPSGRPVRWPYEVVTDRGLVVHLYAVDERQAHQHTTDFELSHVRTPVFVILNLPVPSAHGTCTRCGEVTLVTTYGLGMWGPGISGIMPGGYLKDMCGPCSVATYIEGQSGSDCQECDGLGYKQPLERALECYSCNGRGTAP